MSLTQIIIFIAAVVILAIALRKAKQESFSGEETLFGKQVMWWFVDNETNSRNWWDFGARNSHLPNRGYLELALECAQRTQGAQFSIRPLLGRQAVSEVLREAGVKIPDGIDSVPVGLWRQWVIANLCAAKGGLAVCGDCTLFIGPAIAPSLTSVSAAAFGIYPDDPRAVPGSETAPAPWMGWSGLPHHSSWDIAAEAWTRILGAGPTSWSAAEARRENLNIWNFQKLKGIQVLQSIEAGRNSDGSERTLEDLFGREAGSGSPIPAGAVYVPMDSDKLVRMYKYAWFVRMSKQQILESKFVWADLAHQVMIRAPN